MSSLVFERFLSTPEMTEAFGEEAIVQGMLDFEAALARAQAAAGVIPASAGEAIAGACRVEGFDLNAIVAASSVAGTLAIPLVKQLQAAVAQTEHGDRSRIGGDHVEDHPDGCGLSGAIGPQQAIDRAARYCERELAHGDVVGKPFGDPPEFEGEFRHGS